MKKGREGEKMKEGVGGGGEQRERVELKLTGGGILCKI